MNRVLLINKTKNPTRDELVTSERRTGELLFAQFPELMWAGFILNGHGGKAANWIIPDQDVAAFHDFVSTIECENYDIAVFANGKSHVGGGQCEVRVI